MKLKGKKIGFAVTGSHCTLSETLPQIEKLKAEGAEVFVIFSESVLTTSTRFGTKEYWYEQYQNSSGNSIISTISEAEPIGPKNYLDCIIIAPCTGNTLGKLANGITDSSVVMAAKAGLRNLKPVVIAISTNDGLANSAKNLGVLLNTKNIYFVPFRQDDPHDKPNSLVANMDKVVDSIVAAIEGKQLQPIIDN
ncbi:dipicolinate synthase subunit B [Desulfonispora thiosulfatigenes DSM 11270]|uniref:Dipicolinate synthase subunit B n=1 Tax=Desulfonispora thiosulfatigenes DSM 11270 TaxID=656914 RepID=A0A1W1VNJ7_DESTI|nr:dipicolinate synthase subunit B [Desulfonispora thiosulfatigenes]SMB94524.1 dipicolinate synthase subunit B [Desulfonispora thiosulfatigenes DSM 11270]